MYNRDYKNKKENLWLEKSQIKAEVEHDMTQGILQMLLGDARSHRSDEARVPATLSLCLAICKDLG